MTERIDNKGFKASAVDIHQKQPEQLFFAYDQPTWDNEIFNNKFWKSTDGGQQWTNITDKLPILKWRYISGITTNPNDANEVYVCLGLLDQDEVHKVYRSTDGGESWSNWSDGLPPLQCFKIMFIDHSKSGVLVSTINGLYYRNQKSATWERISGIIPPVAIRDFEMDYNTSLLYVSTYGNGVWVLEMSEWMLTN